MVMSKEDILNAIAEMSVMESLSSSKQWKRNSA